MRFLRFDGDPFDRIHRAIHPFSESAVREAGSKRVDWNLAGAFATGERRVRSTAGVDLAAPMRRGDGASVLYSHHDLDTLLHALRTDGDLGQRNALPIPHLFLDEGEGRPGFSPIDVELAQVLEACERSCPLSDALGRLELSAAARGQPLTPLALMVDQGILVHA